MMNGDFANPRPGQYAQMINRAYAMPSDEVCYICGRSFPYMSWNGERVACEEHMNNPPRPMAWYLDQLGDA